MHNELDLVSTVDPADLRVGEFDVRGAVFIIPSDAPVPSELSDVDLPVGSLYARLAPLDVEQTDDFAFVPVSGAELLSLDRVWRSIARPKRIYALFELPGARYDVLFTQSVRQLGIQQIDWPSVAQAMGDRSRFLQRTRDTAAYMIDQDLARPSGRVRSSTAKLDAAPLTAPEQADEDQS